MSFENTKIPKFRRCVLQNFPFIEADFDALTDYQLLCKVVEYLNKVIDQTNSTSESMNQLNEAFVELKNYVDHYFDNLDVQEEINNKLDQMVEDGTFEEILQNFFDVSILFPKQSGEIQSGDAILIKIKNKNILIDTHLSSNKSNIEAFLTRHSATTLDYVILTHYHADHVGNVQNLITDGYITNETTVYLPGYSSLIESNVDLTNTYLAITSALTNLGCTVISPNEGDTLTVEQSTLTFYNCSQTIFTAENYTDYNDCSTVVELKFGNKRALFTGDISVKPFERFERLKQFNYKIDLYKIEHHGINYDASILPFFDRITPSFAMQTAELGDFSSGAIAQGATTIYLKNKNCKLFSTYENEQDVIFEMSQNEIRSVQGVENYSASNRTPDIPIYVNPATTSTIRDGSSENPFKYLQEAYARIPMNEHTNYVIHLADGTYEDSAQSSVLGKIGGSTHIRVVGNSEDNTAVVIRKSCFIKNGSYVSFENISFESQIAYVENSTVEVKNCIAAFEETGNEAFIYGGGNSVIKVESSEFDNTNVGISGHGDTVIIYNSSFSNITNAIQNSGNGTVAGSGNTYTNCTRNIYVYNGARNISQEQVVGKMLLVNGDYNTLDTDIELADDVSKYNVLIFYIGRQGNSSTPVLTDYNGTGIRTDTNDETVYHFVNYMNQGNGEMQRMKVHFTDGTHMQISEMTNTGLHLRSIQALNVPIAIQQ